MDIFKPVLLKFWSITEKMDEKRIASQTPIGGITQITDIPYMNDSMKEHLLDIYYPESATGKLPVIIDIHGGGWLYGYKEINKYYCLKLAEKGFLTSSCCPAFVDYVHKNFPDLVPFISHNLSPMATIAKYIKEHNGIDVDPNSIFDVQVKRLHEYKRQLMNILHVMYLYNQLKANPNMEFYPRTFIFGAKAAAGYRNAKNTIKLINSVADVINNDPSIGGKIKVVFIEDYRVSIAEWIFAAADVSEQISTASKEASGTGNMKFMLNGAITVGTMDGANVEMYEEVGADNIFIFGMSADEVIAHEKRRDYNPVEIYNNDPELRQAINNMVDGTYARNDRELFRELYNSLLNPPQSEVADRYFILADFRAYANAQQKISAYYQQKDAWARSAILNVAHVGKFSSDRTIQEYVDDIWKLDKIKVNMSGF